MPSFSADRHLPALTAAFERNFRELGEVGASVSVFQGEEEVIHLSNGYTRREEDTPWTAETLAPV